MGHTRNYSKVVLEGNQIRNLDFTEQMMGCVATVKVIQVDKFHMVGEFIKFVSNEELKENILKHTFNTFNIATLLNLVMLVSIIGVIIMMMI